ncbi:hypothetical protein [Bacillus massiliigorillae]|uniref:hypothetical protein n=1 Tax=Bacillus massiliigorillae TaxID=1243664 RepID=UPI0003A0E294|nr:hypothetical protein [Bacillus massiliigorillae]
MNAVGNHNSTKHNSTDTLMGSIIFAILAVLGLGGTITSAIHIYDLYVAGNMEWLIIWSFFGVFMLAWFAYFTKELYQLVKDKWHVNH